ncbi:hypothetical protein Tco_1349558 [Tanacetum coccineum]
MLEDLKYDKSVEKEVDDLKMEIDDLKSQLEHEKIDFLKVDDLLLQEFFEKDFVCAILLSLDDVDEYCDMACKYLEKFEECERLETELSKSHKQKHDKNLCTTRETLHYFNPRVSTSTRVIQKTSVSRPQLRSTQMKEKVMPNNSQLMLKKKEAEDHHRISSFSNKTKSVTACNDNLQSKTLNAKVVCVTCDKCVFNSNHDACVFKFINDVNARTKKPKIVQIIIFIVDSGCTKHMMGNLKLLCNFIDKDLGMVRFGNDQFAPILGYEDLVQGNVTIKKYYYVEGLNHNLFSVGQLCNADLEVVFKNLHALLDIFRETTYLRASPTQACSNLDPQQQQTSNYDNSILAPQLQEVVPPTDKTDTSLQELELLFSLVYKECFNARNQSVSKSFALYDNL